MNLTEDQARLLLAARGLPVPDDLLGELAAPMSGLLQQTAGLAQLLDAIDADRHCGNPA